MKSGSAVRPGNLNRENQSPYSLSYPFGPVFENPNLVVARDGQHRPSAAGRREGYLSEAAGERPTLASKSPALAV